jgi:hypothetical protein
MDSTGLTEWVTREMEQAAVKQAKSRTATERWNRDVTVFAFSILIIVVILLESGVGMEIVVPVAVLGLLSIWLMGWLQAKRLYLQIYREELDKLEQTARTIAQDKEEESIEEKLRQAMRDMWR